MRRGDRGLAVRLFVVTLTRACSPHAAGHEQSGIDIKAAFSWAFAASGVSDLVAERP
jgi:hypothetical protein